MAFFNFNNRGESEKRVRLVPKSPNATIKGRNGEAVDFLSFGEDGYGFCLGKADAVSDYFLSNLYPLDRTNENVTTSIKINDVLQTIQPFPNEDVARFDFSLDDAVLVEKVKYSQLEISNEDVAIFGMMMDDIQLKDLVKYTSTPIFDEDVATMSFKMDDVVLRNKAIETPTEVQNVTCSLMMNDVVRS